MGKALKLFLFHGMQDAIYQYKSQAVLSIQTACNTKYLREKTPAS